MVATRSSTRLDFGIRANFHFFKSPLETIVPWTSFDGPRGNYLSMSTLQAWIKGFLRGCFDSAELDTELDHVAVKELLTHYTSYFPAQNSGSK